MNTHVGVVARILTLTFLDFMMNLKPKEKAELMDPAILLFNI